jgi:outer membrane protein TolC
MKNSNLCLCGLLALSGLSPVLAGGPPVVAAGPKVQTLTLEQCLGMGLKQNHKAPISQFAVAMAESQHRQALAGYWPQVNGKAGIERLSDPLNFILPGFTMPIPGQTVSIPGQTLAVTIPANAFGPGFPPSTIQMPINVPAQSLSSPAQAFQIPQENIKVLDQNLATGSLTVDLLLFDGGMRKGFREQSQGFLAMMREEARRTDLEVADSIKRMYWGAVLARQLHQLGSDTLERMEATLQLTERMYKEGAGKVMKTDYLDNQVMVESLRAMVAALEKNAVISQAALANTMGLPWDANVKPASEEIPFEPYAANLEELAGVAYEFNPDWVKLEAATRAAEGAVTTARSGHYPKLALTGELHRSWNGGFDAGLATSQNLNGWTAGIGLEIPLFDGFLTRNKVSEASARLNQLKETRFLLQEGIGLQIKDLVLGLDATIKTNQATLRAMKAAQDNRDLNTRAYQDELVETDKVIRSQLMEALMSAQNYKSRYDYVELLSRLNLVVGTEVSARLVAKR